MVNRIKIIWLVAFICVLTYSCQNRSYEVIDGLEYVAVQTESNGKWGMIRGDGSLLFADEFKHEPSQVTDGLFSVKEGNYLSLYSVSSKPLIVKDCDDLVSVGVYKDGFIPLTHEGKRIIIVNGNGELKGTLDPIDGKEIVGCSSYCNDGLFVVYDETNKFGYVDPYGNVVIKPNFEYANIFSEGLALVTTKLNEELRYLVIDKNGKEVFHLRKDIFPEASFFSYGLLRAKNSDETWGFIDRAGIFIKARGKVKRIGDFKEKSFVYMNDEYLWGVMGMDGDILIRPKYSSIKYLPDGNYLVKADDVYFILDSKGDRVRTIEGYENVEPLVMGRVFFIAKDMSYYRLLDVNGKAIGDYTIYGIANNEGPKKDVNTDYFNFNSVLESFVGQLTENGYDIYDLNAPVMSLGIEDYEFYLNKTRYLNQKMTKSGWDYKINVELIADESIALWDYYENVQKVILNQDARIESLNIALNSSKPLWKELKDRIISLIKSKGYTLATQTESTLSFKGKNCRVIVNASTSGEAINMRIERSDIYPKDKPIMGGVSDGSLVEGKKLSSYNDNFFRGNTGYRTTQSGLKYVTVVEGTGSTPRSTDNVRVYYTGRLLNGTVFDSSIKRNSSSVFPLQSLISGWREALQLMKVGGVSVFYIPSELAYGEFGAPGTSIGPNMDLIFEIQLIGIE